MNGQKYYGISIQLKYYTAKKKKKREGNGSLIHKTMHLFCAFFSMYVMKNILMPVLPLSSTRQLNQSLWE